MITSLFDLDRTVRDASLRLTEARRNLRALSTSDEPIERPLAALRPILAKDTLSELTSVPDPLLVPPLRLHLATLILARVLWDDEVAIARAFAEPSSVLEEGTRLPSLPKGLAPSGAGSLLSPRTLLAALMVDPDDRRRARVADTFTRVVRDKLRDPVRRGSERRAAAAAQLGVPLAEIDLPAPAAALSAAATELLAATAPMAPRFAPWDRALPVLAARDAVEGWPAHLSPRWVMSVFAGTELGQPGAIASASLPPVLGGASFARALAAFGEAFGHAAGPSAPPFAIARPVSDLRPMRVGALFALLAGESVFARRTLGLGPSAARAHARIFARSNSAWARLAAAAVRTHGSLFPPSDDLDDCFCEETARAFGEPLPRALAGVLPRIDARALRRFSAMLLAALDRAQMIERFDEDWYRNPRSVEALRALSNEPSAPVTEETLRRGASELAKLLLSAA